MGLLLSILFSYVGAVEMMFIVRDIVHQVGLHHERMKVNRSSSETTSSSLSSSPHSLHDLQQNLRKSIKSAQERLYDSDTVQSMEDGVRYEKGYRIPNAIEEDISKRWLEARASVTIEPPASSSNLNHVKNNNNNHNNNNNNDRHIVVASDLNKSDDISSENDSLRSSSLSVETIIENKKFNDNADIDGDDDDEGRQDHYSDQYDGIDLSDEPTDEVPNIHFDEYSKAYLHALDGVKRKTTLKNDELRRRKGFKYNLAGGLADGGGGGGGAFQRRRSEDIDGETDNPWGELKPEQFHDADLWKRERAMSIAEHDEIMAIMDEKAFREQFKRTTKISANVDSFADENVRKT